MQSEDTRVCSYCQEPREPLAKQRRENYGRLICDPCQREQVRVWQQTSQGQASLSAASDRRYQKGRALLAELKSGPCVDCGKSYIPRAMHFDHRDPTAKRYSISTLASANRVKAMLEEIAKCDLVCANCHAYRTERQVQAGLLKTGRPKISKS